MAWLRIEFFVEPFREGDPGPHVTAAQQAVVQRGHALDIGPFGSSFVAEATEALDTLRLVSTAAVDNGATRLAVQIDTVAGEGGG
ncbi:MAG: hypothetical protein AB7L13_23565 [Acidimicrobiia bacterium]